MLIFHYARISQELWVESKFYLNSTVTGVGSTVREGKKKKRKEREKKKLWRNRFSAYPVCCETKQASKQMTGSGPK